MLRRFFLLVASLFACTTLVTAQETLLPIVANVTENTLGTQITINGTGFGTRVPKVSLGAAALTVTASTDTSITANLPTGIAPGAYLLTVQNAATHLAAIFEAAIGQIGPAGPAGPAGAQGPA
ncbi:MAG: IPT/TIG domain-containing protein, partial [Terracidiphilus sp.]